MDYSALIDVIGKVIDLLGVSAIILGIFFALMQFLRSILQPKQLDHSYDMLRQNLGRTLIIGLELLIAGDIVRSIAVPPSFTTVGILAIIVLIRAFLSVQIGNESEWHFPWNHRVKS